MKFQVLGPLEVVEGDASLPLGGPKQRAVLTALLLHADTAVAKHRIIEWIWAGNAPARADHTVETYVSRLRALLGTGRITATGGGYRLHLEPGELDATVATALAEQAQVATTEGALDTAAELVDEALGLFRGPVLGDLHELLFIAPDVARLESLKVSLLERRAELALASGSNADAAGQLEALVTLYPEHERLWELLMLAHYQAGRQAAALQAFARARRHLVHEVGIEPGPGLAGLHARILRQDPNLATRPQRAPQLMVPRPTDLGPTRPPPIDSKRRSSRVMAGTAAVVALVAALSILWQANDPPTVPPAPLQGVALVDSMTGEVRTMLPYETVLQMQYSDGLFWFVLGTPDYLAVSIEAIDEQTYEVEHEFAVPYQDIGDFLVDDGSVWITDVVTPEITRIDIATGLVTDRVDLSGGSPSAFRGTSTGAEQIAAAGGSIWVGRTGEVVQVDEVSTRVVRRFSMPYEWGMAAADGRVWICRQDGVTWIDAATGEVGPVAPIDRPQNLVTVGNEVWAADPHGNIYRVGADGGVRIQSQDPELNAAIDLDGDATTVWSAHGATGILVATDTATLKSRQYRVGGVLGGIAVGRHIIATGVDPAIPKLPLGDHALRLAWSRSTADPIDPVAVNLGTNPWMAQMERLTCATLLAPAQAAGRPALVPDLATRQPHIRSDGRVYNFTIRAGRGFAPPAEGTATAKDVQYSIERALSPKLGPHPLAAQIVHEISGLADYRSGRASHISGLRVSGQHLTIRLTKPSAAFPWKMALSYFCVVPSGTPVVPNGLLFAPPSAAPYYVTAHENGGLTVLERNPNYGGANEPTIDTLSFDESLDAPTAVADTVAGRIGHMAMDDPLLTPHSTQVRGATTYVASPLMTVHFLAFNSRSGAFAERRQRLAFVGLLDPGPLAEAQRSIASRSLLPAGIFANGGPQTRPRNAGPFHLNRPLRLGIQQACRECLAAASALTTQLDSTGTDVQIRQVPNMSSISSPLAGLDLVLTSTTLEYPDAAAFLKKMVDADIPAGWLPPGVAHRIRALARLDDRERTSAAIKLAGELNRGAIPVAPYATGVMGELMSQELDCPEAPLPGLGIDLGGCTFR